MTSLNTAKSEALFERALKIFPGGVNSPVRAFGSVRRTPFVVSHGEGPYLIDADGNRYVDFINSWGPLVLGHAPDCVQTALQEQAGKGTSFGACSGLETQLAEIIQSHIPSLEMMRFVNSGTEAGMSVIRLARGFTGRNKIIKCNGCYHGHVDSLLAKAGSGVATLGIPGCAGVPESFVKDTIVTRFNDVEALQQLFLTEGAAVAALILEPVCGNAGLIKPTQEFLDAARSLCSEYGTLLIFDEVMTGFRVGLSGAQGLYGIKPDLTMLGKVIGGGLPVGAFGGRRDIMESLAPLGPVYQAGTLSGNPLAMAAGIATLREWTKDGVFLAAAAQAERLALEMKESAAAAGIPLQTDFCGTMFGFFFSESPVACFEEAQQTDGERFIEFFNESLERGVYFAPSAFEAGFVSAAHTGTVIDGVLDVVRSVFAVLDK